MATSISDIRTAPVGEDLTLESLSLSVIRGIEKMFRVDHKSANGLSLDQGEWGVLQSDNTVARPGTSSDISTYLCFCGTNRFDAKATGQVTLIMNSSIIVKTNHFNAAGSYVVGTELTVKSLGTGNAGVTPAANGEFVLAKVTQVGQGYLVYETMSSPHKKS